MQELIIKGRAYDVQTIHGHVADANKHLETRVSGGGGGSIHGHVAVAPVQSQTVVHDRIFLIDAAGREHAIKLTAWDVGCRAGHVLALAWLVERGAAGGACVAIANETTGEARIDRDAIARLYRPSIWLIVPLPALVAFVEPITATLALAAGFAWRALAGRRGAEKLLSSGAILPAMVSSQLR